MNAMDQKVNCLKLGVLHEVKLVLHMKQEAMQNIFQNSPKEEAQSEHADIFFSRAFLTPEVAEDERCITHKNTPPWSHCKRFTNIIVE